MAEQKATGTFTNPYLFNGKELDEETAMPSQTLDNPEHVDPLNPEINRMFFSDYFEK